MTGIEYERFCSEYLKNQGFVYINVTQTSGDQGVDIIAQKDNVKWAIQCKYYNSSVGNKAIQEVFTGAKYYGCDKALVITNNTFTRAAKELANKTDVVLWENIWPNNPLIKPLNLNSENNKDIIDTTTKSDNYLWKRFYYSFLLSQVLWMTKESSTLNNKYYFNKNEYIKKVNELSYNMADYADFIHRKINKLSEKLFIDCINSILEDEGLNVVLIDWTLKKGEYVFHYSQINNEPLSNICLRRIESHFNIYCKIYSMSIIRQSEITFSINVKKSLKNEISNISKVEEYKKCIALEKIEKYHEQRMVTVNDKKLSEKLFKSLLWELALYIGYDLKFISDKNEEVLIDFSYLNDLVCLYDAWLNKDTGTITMRFICGLNNKAKYDNKYAGIVNQGLDSLCISLDISLIDFKVLSNNVKIINYPNLSFSYIKSQSYWDEYKSLAKGDLQFTNKEMLICEYNFVYTEKNYGI